MRNPHSHAQRFPVGRTARAVTSAALASAVVSATLWSAGADAAALLSAEAGLLAAAVVCRVRGRPTDRAEGPAGPERSERSERTESSDGPERPDRVDRSGRTAWAARADRPADGGSASTPAKGPRTETAPAASQSPSPSPDPLPDREAAAAAFVGIARRIQATVNQELHDLRRMQDRHGDTPEVFGDLLRLDHGVSLIGRLADSLAVLGGADPGRRRTRPVDLLDVVRGAMSRIVEYPRVDVDVPADPAVAAAAVEPVAHALAELLDNATRYSPPDTRVRVGAEYACAPGGDGVELVIFVDDSGVGLNPATRRYAARVLSGAAETDPVGPDGPPRLGLTVVGRLARSTGFEAAVTPGADGGTRASLRLPAALVTAPERVEAGPAAHGGSAGRTEFAGQTRSAGVAGWAGTTGTTGTAGTMSATGTTRTAGTTSTASGPALQPNQASAGPAPAGRPSPRPSSWDPDAVGPSGLPQRRRAVAAPPNAAPVADGTDKPAAGAGQWLGAFMGGKDGGRS